MALRLCPRCHEGFFKHLHDTAHGVVGTHMADTERYQCLSCGHLIYAKDKVPEFHFILDKE